MGEHKGAMMDKHIVLLFVTFSFLCYTANGIICYQCNSYEHAHCDDPWEFGPDGYLAGPYQKYLVECPEDEKHFCQKITQTVRGNETLIRSCAKIISSKQDKCYESPISEGYKYVCDCYWEACNSAALSSVSLLLTMTSCLLISQLS